MDKPSSAGRIERMISHTTDDQGREWALYAIDFDSAEGAKTMYVHALSCVHAAALLSDLIEDLAGVRIERLAGVRRAV